MTSALHDGTMVVMLRALVFATLVVARPAEAGHHIDPARAGRYRPSEAAYHEQSGQQAVGTLVIKVGVVDAEGKPTPVSRHALLISDNPTTAAPRLIVTAPDGTATVKVRPGNYTVESDRPVVFHGKTYQWMQMLDVVAGRDTVLELTAANAEIAALASGTNDPSFLLPKWQDSVVALWTPTTHASAFVIDAGGLLLTSQRVVGTASSVEVQIAPAVKVAGNVLAADLARDVAVLMVDPKAIASLKPVPLPCGPNAAPSITERQEIFAIGVPLDHQKRMTSGTVERVEALSILSDLILEGGSAGGPVFTAAGDLAGITSIALNDRGRVDEVEIVRTDRACETVASAKKIMQRAAVPSGTHLPVEPSRPFPRAALDDAAKRGAPNLAPYQLSVAAFDVTFITPVLIRGSENAGHTTGRIRQGGIATPEAAEALVRPLLEFGNWSDYVANKPSVLLVRVTPKLVEGFWTTVGRVAARTQGVAIPPIKRFQSGFSRLRAFCGNAEVTPVHPFKLEQRISDSEAIYEGLYAFDPGALGPHCGTVKLVVYSEKEPDDGDTRVVDAKTIERIWQDFAPFRNLNR